jgi:23S rRNA (guanosine2251-2'-O)-methyltransferase
MAKDQQIYGIHAVEALIERRPFDIREIFIQQNTAGNTRLQAIEAFAHQQDIGVVYVKRTQLDELVDGASHQGVIAVAKSAPPWTETDLLKLISDLDEPALLLMLDGIQDPHNLGACIRSADAAGVHAVVIPAARAASITAAVRKVSAGAAEHVPIVEVKNLARCMEAIQQAGVWVTGLAGDAEQAIYDIDFKGATAIVMGAEGEGLRHLTRERCDYLARIPMAGTVESLNVSVATGICLFEARRQRA